MRISDPLEIGDGVQSMSIGTSDYPIHGGDGRAWALDIKQKIAVMTETGHVFYVDQRLCQDGPQCSIAWHLVHVAMTEGIGLEI